MLDFPFFLSPSTSSKLPVFLPFQAPELLQLLCFFIFQSFLLQLLTYFSSEMWKEVGGGEKKSSSFFSNIFFLLPFLSRNPFRLFFCSFIFASFFTFSMNVSLLIFILKRRPKKAKNRWGQIQLKR